MCGLKCRCARSKSLGDGLRKPACRLLICGGMLLLGGCILDGESENHPPVIGTIAVTPETIYPDSSALVSVSATDADWDQLSYHWEATAGSFLDGPTRESIVWRAPDSAGVCTLAVAVADEEETVRTSCEISVQDLPRPVIIMDKCPSRSFGDGDPIIFHGEFGDLEPHEFWYSWELISDWDEPVAHPWTSRAPGITEVRYWGFLPDHTYIFRVKCAVGWGDGLLECAEYGECQFTIRTN